MSLRRPLSQLMIVLLALAALAGAARAAAPESVPGELIVKYRSGVSAARRVSTLGVLRGSSRVRSLELINAEVVHVEGESVTQAIATMSAQPDVEYAEPNYILHADATPNDPRFAELYGMRNTGQTGGTAGADIRATSAWDVFTGDPNLKIGVIDTGVDYTHPDLVDNVWTNPGEIPGNGIDDDNNGYVDDVHGYDFVHNDGDPMDDHYHGTHCSGTIAGEGNNGIGVTGVNWHAKIVGIKFLDASGSGSTDAAIAGIQYAVAVGVRLTSNSWGGGGFSQSLLDAINAAGAAGQLFVAAAGNSGLDTDASPSYPASYTSPYIISVAATNHNDQLASFSNFGLTSVDLAAPGVDILSCQPGGGYQLLSGTSMATPHVAGACGLVWGRLPGATNLQIKQLILSKADPIPALTGKCVTGARLNVFMAIADPDSIPPGAVTDLAAPVPGSTTMGLAWTATGDDGSTGRASRYDLRWSTSPITEANFASATPVTGPDPKVAGSAETFEVPGLAYSTVYFFALKAADEFGNTGPLSNVASGTTLGIPNLSVTPASLSQTLLTGATADQPLTLSNTGAGRLDWTAPTPEVLLAHSGLVRPMVIAEPLALGKGEADPRPGILGSGGPDAFGYRWKDSDDVGGPAFGWVDITGVGANAGVATDDGLSAAIPLPFNFPFYGGSFASLRVCSNGFLTFTGSTFPYANSALPSAGAVPNMIAPFWDDQDMSAGGTAYTYYDGVRFIVEWSAVPHYSSGGPYTYETILYPTGEIRLQYQSMAAPTTSATVGIQNATSTVGLNVVFNATYVHDALAIRIIPLAQWLTVSPLSGRIAAGNSQPLNVHFDAAGLVGGTYSGNVQLLSNDPDDSPKLVPATFTVVGAPNILAAPETTAYGQQYAGGTYTRTLVVSNNGTDSLRVSGITASAPSLSVAPGAFVVAPSAARSLTLSWHPTGLGTLDATLDVASNDPDTPVRRVHVTGEAVAAPSFAVLPTSFEETLNTNTAVSRSLRITNSGGSALNWNATSVLPPAAPPQPIQSSAFVGKGMPDVERGPVAGNAGGPDAFGNRWADSRNAGGPAFGWVEIAGTGTQVPFNGDDQNLGPFPVGFSFPFYGTTFNSFRMCTNGWLSFTSTLTSFSNSALPANATGVPENLVAPFWDDLTFSATGTAWYRYDGARLIVEWKAVPRYLEGGSLNTFEAILYPDGRIVYQYLTINAVTLDSHTSGVQNAARNDALQMVYNSASFVANGLAVRIVPPARWLTVTPGSGSIPEGGFADLTVGCNADGLFGGDHSGTVRLASNDPIVPQYDIPALLHVIGVPDVAVAPDSLRFDSTFVGTPRLLPLTVQNAGTSALVVDEFSFDDPSYSTTAGAMTIPPLGSTVVNVTFNPAAAHAFPATVTVKSNDPDTPERVVPLGGVGVVPPDESLSQPSLSITMSPNTARRRDLVLQNLGGSNLYWTVDASVSAAGTTSYAPLALGKGQPDPRQGVLGSGGPDGAGYRWKDSDASGGPVFGWVDITGVGQAHPELLDDDRTVGGYPLGFAFPFYGGSYGTVNIGSNGTLSFTSLDSAYSNQPLPNAGAPATLIAPWWDDLNAASGGAIYTYNDGARWIVEFANVASYASGSGPYTFEAILYPSGRIVLQYQSMGPSPSSATIGTQNGTRDIGLQVVYNAAYVHDHLAVEIARLPTWLTTTVGGGTIVPGGSAIIPLALTSTDLPLGTYEGNVRIGSNDPDEGLTNFPVHLSVSGAAAVGASSLPDRFGLRLAGRNPAAGRAVLELALPARGHASVAIYDARGALVRTLVDGELPGGLHLLRWGGELANGASAQPGMYFVRAVTAGGSFHRRLAFLR